MVEYNGFIIDWDDNEEKFVSEIDGVRIKKTNLREIKKIIDEKDNSDKMALQKDGWFRANSIQEVEILRKKGNGYIVRTKGRSGRGSSVYFLLKNNEKNQALKKEVEELIAKQEELQKTIEFKFEEMDVLR